MIKPLDRRLSCVAVTFALLALFQALLLLQILIDQGQVRLDALPSGVQQGLLQAFDLVRHTQLVALAVALLAFFFWLHRAYANLGPLGATPRWTPGWAVGWWFVPVLNLLRPLQVLSELRMPAGSDGRGPGRALLWVWYTCWLVLCSFVPLLTILISVIMIEGGDHAEELTAEKLRAPALQVYFVTWQCAAIAACGLVVAYGLLVGRRQCERHRLLGLS